MKKEKSFTEDDVTVLLEKKFSAPEWAFFSQVANGTGGTSSRRADGVAFNLWPSRGLAIHGFEVKVSRRDWLNELKNPGKSEDIQKFCDHWWVVAPKDVILEGEVPKTWGHFEVQSGRILLKKEAPELQAIMVDRPFLAALMRKLDNSTMLPDEMKARVAASYDEGKKAGEESKRWKHESTEKDLSRLKEHVQKFETTTGVRIEHYLGEVEAARFKLFRDRQSDLFIEIAENRLEAMRNLVRQFEEKIQAVKLEVADERPDS